MKLSLDLEKIIDVCDPGHTFYDVMDHIDLTTYPVEDAVYGSFSNYIYCEQQGMENYMKFTMFEKETKDNKYCTNLYRAVNFKQNEKALFCVPIFQSEYKKTI